MKFFIDKIISKVVVFITDVLLVLMTLIISYQVFLRFFFKKTPFWSEEISLVIMIWFGLLGAALGVRDNIHINVSFLIDLFPQKKKKEFLYTGKFLLFCFSIIMIVYGYKLVNLTTMQTLPATHISVSFTYLPLIICGILITFYTFFEQKDKK